MSYTSGNNNPIFNFDALCVHLYRQNSSLEVNQISKSYLKDLILNLSQNQNKLE